MTFFIVLVAILLQRSLIFPSYTRRWDWISPYFHWILSYITKLKRAKGLLGSAILILPLVFLTSVIFLLVSGIGTLTLVTLSLLCVFYCMDARDFVQEPYKDEEAAKAIINTYEGLFAITFWYGIGGAPGLILYFFVHKLVGIVPKDEKHSDLRTCMKNIENVLDWVPVRLLGLIFAVVGDFSKVLQLWIKNLKHNISEPKLLIVDWAKAALHLDRESGENLKSLRALINRSLILWLLMLFLLSSI